MKGGRPAQEAWDTKLQRLGPEALAFQEPLPGAGKAPEAEAKVAPV